MQAKNVAEKDLERQGPDFYHLLNQPISAALCYPLNVDLFGLNLDPFVRPNGRDAESWLEARTFAIYDTSLSARLVNDSFRRAHPKRH